jgi:hypothetical protein
VRFKFHGGVPGGGAHEADAEAAEPRAPQEDQPVNARSHTDTIGLAGFTCNPL